MKPEDIILSYNNSGLEELSGLSPNQTHDLIHNPNSSQCVVKLNGELSDEILEKIPFFRLCEEFLKIVSREASIKLTPLGSLQKKVIAELYEHKFIPEESIESGLYKVPTEDYCRSIAAAKLTCQIANLTRKEKGKLMLTIKGQKALIPGNRKSLFKEIYDAFTTKFNWGFFDNYPQEPIGQYGNLFSIYLISKFGKSKRETRFYAEKYQKVFYKFLDLFEDSYASAERQFQDCYSYRTFNNFLNWFGLIKFEESQNFGYLKDDEIISTRLTEQLFKIEI